METNKLILACLITLCSLPVAAQVKLGIEAGANLSNYITDSHSNPSDSKNMKVGFQAGLTVDYVRGEKRCVSKFGRSENI